MKRTFANLLRTEAQRLKGFVYSSFPYSCGMTEALVYARRYDLPSDKRLTISRGERATTIQIKPRPGTRKRKPLTVRLWVG
jgi:hypothetical protein